MIRKLALTAVAIFAAGGAMAAEPAKLAFFGLLLIDTSLGASTEAETARLRAMEDRFVEAMTESGKYVFVDIAPIAEKADLYSNLAHCNGCDSKFAAELGADIAVTGEVQKTSNLILSLSVYMRDAATGDLIGGGSADMRGNTDESWARAINYVLKNRILK
ncbi:MAG: DUF3280 domain-containing protein [Pseudomonadota bacterium]